MGLNNARNVIVGNAAIKGISGGERRRLCVAMELITSPKLLFLDEPTSGLDTVTALDLVKTLRKLSRNGCTVLCTIHQPASRIFKEFDALLLLKSGVVLYSGLTNAVIDTFGRAGFPMPSNTNPADFLLDVITPGLDMTLEATLENQRALIMAQQFADVDLDLGADKPLNVQRDVMPWPKQFAVLFQRSMQEIVRKRRILYVSMIQSILMAILIGFVFYDIGNSRNSTTRRQPVIFFCAVNQGVFSALMVINSFPSERALSLRERAAGTYKASAYFLAKTTADALVQIPQPIVFSIIVYFLVGFQDVGSKFIIFTLFMIFCSLSATSLALMVSALCKTTDFAVTVLPLTLEIGRLFGGFFLAPALLPKYFVWLDALSYIKYTVS